jgi:formylglycine-generating enzyme
VPDRSCYEKRVRAALALPLTVCLLASSDGAAAPRRPRTRSPVPVASEARARGIVALRAPGPSEVLIRAGSFKMGSSDVEIAHALLLCRQEPLGQLDRPEDRDALCKEEMFSLETAEHDVYLDDFWIDRTEVSVERYRRCVAAGMCTEPPYGSGAERFDRADLPVVLVSHVDAKAFCAWAGGRLPTEAEWERAAKGAAGRRYPWGQVYNPSLANHGRLSLDELDEGDGFLELAPVGSFRDGRTPDGIEDLAGNVEEWVADWFAPTYPKASAVNPQGPDSGERRVVRGGSYLRARPWLRTTARSLEAPQARRPWIGFRCARSR